MTPKILVVDDEPDVEHFVRQIFRRQIRAGELDLRFAANGQEALSTLANEPDIDMILTDINMPVMDGLTLLEQLRSLDSVTKAVVVSAYGDMKNIRTAMNRGAFDFLTKPFDPDDLKLTIDRTLAHLSQLREALHSHDQLVALRQELEVASRMQQSILPKRFPATANFEIFADMRPAKEVGGDFYDFFELSPTRIGIAIADVSGKGIAAALFMAVSYTLLRASALAGLSPGDCLERVNRLLAADNDAMMFVTVFYGILDTTTGELVYANGGHNPPYLVGASGDAVSLEGTEGIALGVFDGASFEEKGISLEPGDALFLYTDGVTEAFNAAGAQFGEGRVEECLVGAGSAGSRGLLDRVTRAVTEFAGETDQHDDITCLVLSITGRAEAGSETVADRAQPNTPPAATSEPASGEEKLSVTLNNELSEIRRLSELIDQFGKERDWPLKIILDINLALDELITNTISYGYDDEAEHGIAVSLAVENGIALIDIHDDAKAFNPLDAPKPDIDAPLEERSVGGLGVYIVKTLMDRVTYDYAEGHNHLRLEKAIPAGG